MGVIVIYIDLKSLILQRRLYIYKKQKNQSLLRSILSPNTESSIEQLKWNSAFFEKSNNSTGTKL